MFGPEPGVAPVIPPVIAPTVHVNVLAALAVRAIFVAVPLQIETLSVVVTTGVGCTVTVIVYAGPWQAPAIDVGTTIYSTVPGVALPGLLRVCDIVGPLPALAPVIPPVMLPMVQVKVLAELAVNNIAVVVLSQMEAELGVVTTGVG